VEVRPKEDLMRKVIVSTFLTIDGVMQAPGGQDEDRSGGFEHGGWQVGLIDDIAGKLISEGLAGSGGLLLGRRTYEIFAAYWPDAPEDDPIAATMNGLPKYVASTILQEPLGWQNSTLLQGDVERAVAKLREEPGNDLLVIGSGVLAQTLMAHDLVDEYQLMIHPIILRSGRRLFNEDGPRTDLRLVNVTPTGTGVLVVTYRPAGRASEDLG
jgi:dihydrofolate reductase